MARQSNSDRAAQIVRQDGSPVATNGPVEEMSMQARAPEVGLASSAAAIAVAERARAVVQARHIMALHRPRNPDAARVRILRQCERYRFAEAARYAIKNRGEGWTIRFIEAALGAWGNVDVESQIITESDVQRIVRVAVVDMESNVGYSQEVTVDKTVERKVLREGERALSSRTNSEGKVSFLVAAGEAELLQKTQAIVSKAIRTQGKRLIPADVLDEALEIVQSTLKSSDRADPDAARKKLVDAFAAIGVMPTALKTFLGHDLGECSPAEIAELRGIYQAIRSGETTWRETMGEKGRGAAPAAAEAQAADVGPIPLADVIGAVHARRLDMVDAGEGEAFVHACIDLEIEPTDWATRGELVRELAHRLGVPA